MALIDFLDVLADAASEAILPHFRQRLDVENKKEGAFDPVTVADRASEEAMRALITEHYPDHGVLGEEFDNTNLDAERVWILDPIDGTKSFISGAPVWGTLIGHKHKGLAEIGMMCQPFTGERFVGGPDGSFFKHRGVVEKIKTRPCKDLSAANLFTTSPDMFAAKDALKFQDVSQRARLTRYGLDCYAYCLLAMGHADLVIESSLESYDIAALVPVIENAGGRVTTWDGGNPVDGGSIVASGDPLLHEAVLKLLN